MPPVRRNEGSLVILNKRISTQLEAKMAPALRVVAKKALLRVARHSFGVTKPHSSRLDERFFSHNSDNSISDIRSQHVALSQVPDPDLL